MLTLPDLKEAFHQEDKMTIYTQWQELINRLMIRNGC